MGPTIHPTDIDQASLWIDRKTEVPKPPPLLRIYNKPKWVLSVMHDSKGRKNVGDLDFVQSMHPVGRLDYDSSGLLLFSSDGILTQQLLHPTRGIEKEYVATVVGRVDEDSLREQLAKGVETSLGIVDNLPEEYDLDRLREKGHLFFEKATELSTVRLIVKEGPFPKRNPNIPNLLDGSKNSSKLWISGHTVATRTAGRHNAGRLGTWRLQRLNGRRTEMGQQLAEKKNKIEYSTVVKL
eukprot:scaffold2435_cov121-Cylindrotheca_fusiformis.AAC.4